LACQRKYLLESMGSRRRRSGLDPDRPSGQLVRVGSFQEQWQAVRDIFINCGEMVHLLWQGAPVCPSPSTPGTFSYLDNLHWFWIVSVDQARIVKRRAGCGGQANPVVGHNVRILYGAL